MTDYSFLNQIDSPILNSIYESKDFEENEKLIFSKKYSFSEIYSKILDLKNGKQLDFWKAKENLNLPDYLNSILVDFYIAKYVQCEDEKFWLETKNTKFLEYLFTHHFNYEFMKEYEDAISKLFGDKWVVKKIVQNSEYQTLSNYPNLRLLIVANTKLYSVKDLPNLPFLKSIIFVKCIIPSFESLPRELPNLDYLCFEECNLKSFVDFPNTPKLKKMIIGKCQFVSFQYFPQVLPDLYSLTLTIMNNSDLTSLECFPRELPSLRELDIDGQTFKCLPTFSNLTHLTIGKLSSFEEISALPNLLYLNVVYNQITSSFEHFPKLKNLKELIIGGSESLSFEHFPILPNLEKLVVKYSSLTSFEYFPILPNLKELNVDFNRISSFEHFPILSNLKELNIYFNQITSFEHFPSLSNLEKLDINFNKLTSFEYFPILPNLKELNISSNQITSFKYFPTLPNLKELNIRSNRITSFKHFPILPNLKKLNASHNKIIYVNNNLNLNKLLEFKIDDNPIISFENTICVIC